MKALELPHGPWRQVLSGIWDEREVSYHENPDKRLLVMIYDQRGDKVKGMATIMTKFFSVNGNASTFASELVNNTILIQKKTPEFKGSFLGVITDPIYVEYTPRNLINQVDAMYKQINVMSEDVMKSARDYSLDLISIEHAGAEQISELFGEPLALPMALTRKAGHKTVMETPVGQVFLGIDMERKPIKEDIKTFSLTILSGKDTKPAAHIIMEGHIMNGIPGIIFDKKEEFSRMDTPNREAPNLQEYGEELEPLSMPVRTFNPGSDVYVDLTAMNEKLFADVAGISDKKTALMIGRILADRKVKNLEDIVKKLGRVTEEEDKYFAARGARICRLLDDVYPHLFNGSVEANELIAPWMKRIGRIAHINLRGLDKRVVKGIIYSVLKTIYEELKEETSKEEVKISILLEGSEIVSGKGSYIDKEINALVKLCTSSGIGICIRTPHESEVDKDLIMNATARITCLENNEISVKTQAKQPFRTNLRPTLSGV